MHSNDLVEWLIKIIKKSNKQCPIYNVGSDRVINLRDLTRRISKLSNKKCNINKISSNDWDYYVPSIAKAKKRLNLKISINLNDALNSIIKRPNDKN